MYSLSKAVVSSVVLLKSMIDGKNVQQIPQIKPIVMRSIVIPTPQENKENIIRQRMGKRTPLMSMTPASANVMMKSKPKQETFMSHSFMLTRGETVDENEGESDKDVDDVISKEKNDEIIQPNRGNVFKFNPMFPTHSTNSMETQDEDVFSFDD